MVLLLRIHRAGGWFYVPTGLPMISRRESPGSLGKKKKKSGSSLLG